MPSRKLSQTARTTPKRMTIKETKIANAARGDGLLIEPPE